jgi:hypothetical protein
MAVKRARTIASLRLLPMRRQRGRTPAAYIVQGEQVDGFVDATPVTRS